MRVLFNTEFPKDIRGKIGVTNRIRTGTNAVTGRDAAVTSWSP